MSYLFEKSLTKQNLKFHPLYAIRRRCIQYVKIFLICRYFIDITVTAERNLEGGGGVRAGWPREIVKTGNALPLPSPSSAVPV